MVTERIGHVKQEVPRHVREWLLMSSVHLVFGWLIVAGYFVAMAWGLGAWAGRRPRVAIAYWWWQRGVAALLAVQVLLGLYMLGRGQRPPDALHYLYAALLLVGVAFVESLKPGGRLRRRYAQAGRPLRELPLAAFLGFALWAIALRALMTGLGGF